ncbi:histidine ammonia-lyase [Candidatus Roizmanbacteria bacterium CG02_land_8_20_14_3_00_36_15]|uniref:Histidine ammonia-lyase n=2 Tax=Candidatus Roizmaniibacteriota TaxID=1752723 RepID=A0A2M8KJS2_9BACT|nr:MAG: histidine ammonia-lyase [Candidatus Roizmanbacteria bacterium CG03_land_8_20_14_0_80_36_21]PIV38223.1 MAG: histidine ammonia-lyase [Candidatus Roizmanbacteria bacterium CG02_land_8_20_14_3_00_36_15]PIY70450.1 MAG: histidine ammonia-lyase [Candidatus Roizmanbacteria bacterium CG_4_10_14_0_8_um_filter_36_36]PJA53709.1 MAG: histidine ammonia-lyase [Candidatus Roizmanbacteria bacterium CG_4_9_14_3_um_filter_36_11]PJE60151.1 MAG: histidine ammonia-lyase [Candidatus Roizmanbacteria bacterium 
MSKVKKIFLTGLDLKIEDVIAICRDNTKVIISLEVIKKINDNWKAIEEMLDRGDVMYGLNTGIGGFGNVVISKEKAGELSTRMLRAHASGYGNPVEPEIAKASLLLRLNVFAKGYSGVRPILFTTFVQMLNKNVIPVFYEKGSVGTSGDLAPLSQMGLVVIGEGKAYWQGKIVPGADAMKKAGIKPVPLAYREGLAIMNGSQFMTAIAAFNIFDAERLIKQTEIVCSMTIDVLNCVESAYSEPYNRVRPFKGQNDTAENIRRLIAGSDLMEQPKKNVQNAYSLRSVPQVAGACRDALDYIRKITKIEMNAVADNPIFFTKEKICRTGANFHGAPIGYTQDLLGIIITDLGNISERQTNNLMDPACSKDLPAFLVKSAGLDSGLMISQYTQAALVSENKILASPASVDSIPVSGNQEDHVSFGTIAARKAREIIKNTEAVVAIQLLATCQAYEFRKPVKPSKTFQAIYKLVRSVSPAITEDRAFYIDIEKVVPLIRNYQVLKVAEETIGKLK